MKWSIIHNNIIIQKTRIWILPCLSVWYEKDYFLETGVTTPACGINFSWLIFRYVFTIQQTY